METFGSQSDKDCGNLGWGWTIVARCHVQWRASIEAGLVTESLCISVPWDDCCYSF